MFYLFKPGFWAICWGTMPVFVNLLQDFLKQDEVIELEKHISRSAQKSPFRYYLVHKNWLWKDLKRQMQEARNRFDTVPGESCIVWQNQSWKIYSGKCVPRTLCANLFLEIIRATIISSESKSIYVMCLFSSFWPFFGYQNCTGDRVYWHFRNWYISHFPKHGDIW